MRSFVSPERLWASNARRVHVCLVPDHTQDNQLGVLIDRARLVASRFGCVSPVEHRWVHVPVAVLANVLVDRGQVVKAMTEALEDVSAFTMTVGSVIVGEDRMVLDCDGDSEASGAPVTVLRGRIVRALAGVGGVVSEPVEPVHMTIAYGRGDGDSGRIATEMRQQVRVGPSPFMVNRVLVVDVQQDPSTGTPTWREIARIGLREKADDEKGSARESG